MYNLKNKTVLITGASSGIGATTAIAFAREGANVAITYKENLKGAKVTALEIEKLGSKVLIIQADLISEIESEKVINETKEEFGGLDILINNAGRYIDGDEWNGNAEIWTKTLQQNLVSVMNVSKYAIQIFQDQKSGIIINISSRFSTQGQNDALAYASAKAGVINITQAYAKLLIPFGRANAISPGAVNTGYWLRAPREEVETVLSEIPLGKFIEPQEIAEMALFLASEKSKNITGQNIFIDGGYSI